MEKSSGLPYTEELQEDFEHNRLDIIVRTIRNGLGVIDARKSLTRFFADVCTQACAHTVKFIQVAAMTL